MPARDGISQIGLQDCIRFDSGSRLNGGKDMSIAAVMVICVNGGGGRPPIVRQKYPASNYAAYQIKDTLSMVETIKVDIGAGKPHLHKNITTQTQKNAL